jgi:putative DNA primase/helicase
MEAGDGRNQALFNYILTLQSNDFAKEEAQDCIRLINQFILKEPLSESELEVILRDDAFKKPIFFKGNTFLFDKFAVFLKNNAHIIKINNQLHFYENGIYRAGKKKIEAEMLKLIPQLSRSKRNEVYEYLDTTIQENSQSTDADLIAFRNGIYNINTNELIPGSPEHIITNRINWDYNPNAYNELADGVLNKISCHDCEIRALLEELIGYCFYRRNELGKAFILTGEKNNGKSTYIDMIETLLGEENISSLDLKELPERFKTAEVFGKLANLGDDIGDEFIPNTGIFKKLVTGDGITGEKKAQDPFKFHSFAKLLFSANNIPRMGKGKDSAALVRRLVIIPFDARFDVNDPDYKPYIKYELRKQPTMEYLILIGLEGLKRILKNNKFTTSSKVQKSLEEYEEINNPILGFFKEIGRDGVMNEVTNKIYLGYQEYCIRDNVTALSNIEFSRQVKKFFDLEIVDRKIRGEKRRLFVERSENK